ncbi:PD-(D/E)XK nuclease family protein [Clostridioides difficile]|nr:PD-(D/E)XK nuclease family protein [Clostridioides difficile]NJJ37094.1 PD-(D/E)XK nuclease family protein [Clostridioides difficile]NJK16090.1 PD-(D/E)XK nuclease family protein [Clostridioides difficile]
MSRELYSFSKLNTFYTCPFQYYLTYIKNLDREQNCYGYYGNELHRLLEELQQRKMTNQEAIQKYNEVIEYANLMDYNFPTPNSRINYLECILHYLEYFVPIECDKYCIEEYFEYYINGITMRGYIDLYYIIGNKVYVIDYKSSSKFSKKDLSKKSMQLILYAMYLKEKYPDKMIEYVAFDMCKYIKNEKGVLIERNKIDNIRNYERAIVKIKYTKALEQQLIAFVTDTVKQIKQLDFNDESVWCKNDDKSNQFFCKTLCSHYGKGCKYNVNKGFRKSKSQ